MRGALIILTSNYAAALGARLRAIRQQQGLSLQGVEQKSQGRWKAVVVGSYERGDRAITAQRLAEIAEFYGVPVTELLPGNHHPAAGKTPDGRVVIDLERLNALPPEESAPLCRFVSMIQSKRGDYNGRVLSVRRDDLQVLALLYDTSAEQLADRLIAWGVLAPEARTFRPLD